MAKRKEITVACYLILEDGKTAIPMDEATPEQMSGFRANAERRLSETMSAYYSRHPEEYIRLCEELDRKERSD